jgi:hypothetical protein
MTNTPGWASPGSSGSPEPDGGDSPEDTPSAPTTPAAPAPDADPRNGAGDTSDSAQDAPEAQDAPPESAASGVWAQHQPPPAPWQHTPSGAAAQPPEPAPSAGTAPPEASPPPPVAGQPGSRGRQWAPPPPPPPHDSGPRWGPAVVRRGAAQPPYGTQQPAPQPGVIPLRPLDVGEILMGATSTLRQHWRAATLLAFVVGLLTESANALISGFLIDDTRIDDLNRESDPSVHDILHALSGTAAASLLLVLTSMIGVILTAGLLTAVISRAVLGRPTTVRSVWQDVRPRLAQLVGLALLLPLALCAIVAVPATPGLLIALAGGEAGGASLASLGLICGIVVSIWQWNLWSLTGPALMLEKQGMKAALKRSVKLVNGSWWRVLGVQLLMLLVAGVASVAIQVPFALLADAIGGDNTSGLFATNTDSSWTTIIVLAIGGVISATLTLPISAGAVSLLYVDQRIRREALDIDLGRAAKVPGYQAPATVDGRR